VGILITIAQILLVCVALYFIIKPTVGKVGEKNLEFCLKVWKHFGVAMFFQCFLVVLVTTAAFFLLRKVPGLNWGWTNLFFKGGGNIIFAPLAALAELPPGSKPVQISLVMIILLKVSIAFGFLAFFGLLVIMFPNAAWIEEEMFRKGRHTFGRITKASIAFGLVHLLVGVPLAAAIALIIPGFFYGFVYASAFEKIWGQQKRAMDYLGSQEAPPLSQRQWDEKMEVASRSFIQMEEDALMASTAYHAMNNTIVVGIMFTIIVVAIFLV